MPRSSLLSRFRDTARRWFVGRDRAVETGRERVKAQLGALHGKVWLLPYADSYTGETQGMRDAYRKMLKDPSVKAAVLDKVLTVASLDQSVNPGDDSESAKIGADFGRHVLDNLRSGPYGEAGIRAVVSEVIFPALIDGYAVAEKIWCEPAQRPPFAGKVTLKYLKGKDTRDLQIETNEYREITGIVGRAHNAGERFDPRDFVIWSHMPLFGNPAGMSDLRAAYRAWWLIDTAWKFRAIHLEKFSSPMLKGTYTDGGQKDQLEDALESAKAATWITVPEGVLVEAFELSQRGTADYKSAIDDLKHEVFLGISGAILQALEGSTTEGRGSSAVHKSTSDIRKWHLSACVQDVVNDQIFRDATDINFVATAYPKLVLGGVNDSELSASLAVDVGLSRDLRLNLSKKDLYKRYGRPEPTDAEDMLAPMAVAAPPTVGGLFSSNGNGVHAEPGVSAAEPFREDRTSWGYTLQHVANADGSGD